MSDKTKAILILKISLAFAFVYAAMGGFLNPDAWIGYAPIWVVQHISDHVFLLAFGIIEIVLAVLLLFMNRLAYPALAATVLLVGMVVCNLGALDIVFRDISLALAAVALFVLSNKKNHE